MELKQLTDAIKARADFSNVGMILAHTGIVRSTSRDGREVSGLKVRVDHDRLTEIVTAAGRRPGILDVRVWINEEKDLSVGDTVMHLVVAGDFRENVLRTLETTLNDIKGTVTSKTEYFI